MYSSFKEQIAINFHSYILGSFVLLFSDFSNYLSYLVTILVGNLPLQTPRFVLLWEKLNNILDKITKRLANYIDFYHHEEIKTKGSVAD